MAKLMVAERQDKIIELLSTNGSLNMAELAEKLGVSKETVRRDLIYLSENGSVKKMHGGATLNYDLKTHDMNARITADLSVKEKISQRALDFLPDQGVIFLDCGSTVTCFAKLLSQKSGLTIITDSLSAANALLNSNNIVHVTGGQINSINMSLYGFQTTNFLNTIKVELAVMGTNGYEQHSGPTTCDFLDAQSKQTVLKNSKASIVLADSSKATTISLTQYATWREIDHLITDSGISQDTLPTLEEYTDVVIV